jgi:hypothetical protein
MATLTGQLVQDSVSLIQFVSSIADLCEEKSSAPAHLPSSERFFGYVSELANATATYLANGINSNKTPRELLHLRGEIASLRVSWRFLHQFVKPALDADTLRLPTALVQATILRFREIPRFANADFVLYHSDVFNYLNVTLAVFKQQAKQISSLVAGPEFPDNLSIIGIPYSQASSLFMNCLIPHEMGHYAFGELSLALKFKIQLENELISRAPSIKQEQTAALVELLARWIEELFCDAFAVRIVGFCFSLAFVELFDVAQFLDESGRHKNAGARGETEFASYPPDLLRLRQQVAVLKKDGWWNELQRIDSHYVRALEAADTLADGDFRFQQLKTNNIDPVPVLQSFFAVLPKVESELELSTLGLSNASEKWKESAAAVESYLEHGVVPSTLRSSEGAPLLTPEPVALLNSAYRFYVQSMSKLLSHIEGADENSITHRIRWAKRIETWTAKAIEDVLLLRGRVNK